MSKPTPSYNAVEQTVTLSRSDVELILSHGLTGHNTNERRAFRHLVNGLDTATAATLPASDESQHASEADAFVIALVDSDLPDIPGYVPAGATL